MPEISSTTTIRSPATKFWQVRQLAELKNRGKTLLPGVALSLTIAFAAIFLGSHYSAPVMLFALLLGMVFNFLKGDAAFSPGINFISTTVLRVGVALLGVRITLDQISGLGWHVVLIVCTALVSTIFVSVVISKWLGRNRYFGILTGGAVAICGASAALAITAVLPKGKKGISEEDSVFTVVTVTALSTLAMIIYPIITQYFSLSDQSAGVFIGASIHDVAQVVGAGYSVSEPAGDTATVVKLLRVALLIPVVGFIIAARWFSERDEGGCSMSVPIPYFLFGFMALAILNSAEGIPAAVGEQLTGLSKLALVAAIAALGTKTVFDEILKVGPKALLIVVVNTLWIATVTIFLLSMT